MNKKAKPLTPEEQKRVDFLLSFPGLTILDLGGPHDKKSPLYREWAKRNGKK